MNRIPHNRILTPLAAALMLVLAVGGTALAAAPAVQRARASNISEDAFHAERLMQLARVDIFDGQTASATQRIDAAQKALNAAERDGRARFAGLRPKQSAANAETLWVPVDEQLAVDDAYVDSPAKRQHIGEADRQLKAGNHAKAMDELKLAEVDVQLSRVLMPLEQTRNDVADAASFVKQGKYYEANLALKAAQDRLVIDTDTVVGTSTAHANASAGS